jgi:preprotein translocase subunit SecG
MVTILTVLHVTVCIFLIVIVLLQHGKGADMGASFGGGSGQTVFGTDGPLPLLNKITTGSAVLFMITSVTLAYYSANISKGSIMKDITPPPIEQQLEVPPTTVEMPIPRANTEGDQVEENPADATFPGDASTDPVPVTEKEAVPVEQ